MRRCALACAFWLWAFFGGPFHIRGIARFGGPLGCPRLVSDAKWAPFEPRNGPRISEKPLPGNRGGTENLSDTPFSPRTGPKSDPNRGTEGSASDIRGISLRCSRPGTERGLKRSGSGRCLHEGKQGQTEPRDSPAWRNLGVYYPGKIYVNRQRALSLRGARVKLSPGIAQDDPTLLLANTEREALPCGVSNGGRDSRW